MAISLPIRVAWQLLLAGALLLRFGPGAVAADDDSPAGPAPPQDAAQQAGKAWDELPPELQTVLRKLDEANEKLQDVTAKVVYQREIPLLDEKQKSRGTLTFKKPGRIVLKLGKPRNEEVHTDGEHWWVVSHNDKQVEVYKATRSEDGSREVAFLDFGYGTGAEQLVEDYHVELVSTKEREEDGGETLYRLKFTPREREDQPARYAAIEVEVSEKLWLPHVLVLHESGGEIVHTYTLSKIRTNTKVKDELFEYKPPRGYNVVPLDEL